MAHGSCSCSYWWWLCCRRWYLVLSIVRIIVVVVLVVFFREYYNTYVKNGRCIGSCVASHPPASVHHACLFGSVAVDAPAPVLGLLVHARYTQIRRTFVAEG